MPSPLQSPAPSPPELGCWKMQRVWAVCHSLPLKETLTRGAGFAGEKSETKANGRKSLQKQENPLSWFRNLPGEAVALKEILLLSQGLQLCQDMELIPKGHSWDSCGCSRWQNQTANCKQTHGKTKGFLIMKVLLVT